jgi:hypothetical protein
MTAHAVPISNRRVRFGGLNTRWHRPALLTFGAIVVLHWAEHLVQAFQIWVLDYKKPAARGILGQFFPWLIKSEWLHYGFAVVMLVGLALLMPGFTGRGRTFWVIAFAIQVWHMIEHQILFIQAQTHHNWWNSKVPVSILQHYWFPGSRPELHLLYNGLVTIPMVVAIYFHMYPPPKERSQPTLCACARTADEQLAA